MGAQEIFNYRNNDAYICWMAPLTVRSRYSLYIECVPVRESYLIRTPKFLTVFGFFSNT